MRGAHVSGRTLWQFFDADQMKYIWMHACMHVFFRIFIHIFVYIYTSRQWAQAVAVFRCRSDALPLPLAQRRFFRSFYFVLLLFFSLSLPSQSGIHKFAPLFFCCHPLPLPPPHTPLSSSRSAPSASADMMECGGGNTNMCALCSGS